jgi:hypothetical protein
MILIRYVSYPHPLNPVLIGFKLWWSNVPMEVTYGSCASDYIVCLDWGTRFVRMQVGVGSHSTSSSIHESLHLGSPLCQLVEWYLLLCDGLLPSTLLPGGLWRFGNVVR